MADFLNPETINNRGKSTDSQIRSTSEGEGKKMPYEILKDLGIVEEKQENGETYIVVNIEELKSVSGIEITRLSQENGLTRKHLYQDQPEVLQTPYFQEKIKKDERRFFGKTPPKIEFFYSALGDKKIISTEDWNEGAREGKEAFYIPQTKEEAFHIPTIKEADFYLDLWEITSLSRKSICPFSQESIPFYESSLACAIYNQNMGNGYRNAENKLFIRRSRENGEYGPISEDSLSHWCFITNPFESVRENCPNLIDQGLLKPEDFKSFGQRKKSTIKKNP